MLPCDRPRILTPSDALFAQVTKTAAMKLHSARQLLRNARRLGLEPRRFVTPGVLRNARRLGLEQLNDYLQQAGSLPVTTDGLEPALTDLLEREITVRNEDGKSDPITLRALGQHCAVSVWEVDAQGNRVKRQGVHHCQ